jgi:hypothetical protein
MMRSLPFVALLVVLSFPQAQASTVEDALFAVQECVEYAPSLGDCEQRLRDVAEVYCAGGSPGLGCFLCIDFTAFEGDGSIRAGELVTVDPLGKILLSWYGYNFDSGSHEKVQSGQWEVRKSSSQGIMCSAEAGQ